MILFLKSVRMEVSTSDYFVQKVIFFLKVVTNRLLKRNGGFISIDIDIVNK